MQISNPFDDAQGQFYLLQNEHRQYSLWPQQCALPAGWDILSEPQSLDACNAWLAAHWTTLTPAHFAGAAHD
ncbi:MbtH family NRPS accessory protein [Enterobacteriaceae bacterium RIT691]|nr:MbtH family NRPS accessory protein [Enterobacteriaceae bacterium RIT691]